MAQIYTIHSSSAAAANSFVRSIFAAAFPLLTQSLINATGTKWAGQSTVFLQVSSLITHIFLFSHVAPSVSIFAFLSLGLIPIPLFLIRYGKKLRARSRHSQEARRVIVRMSIYKEEGINIEIGEQKENDPERASS